jgi:predicted HAD superfamily phosphohydrolase YqeG
MPVPVFVDVDDTLVEGLNKTPIPATIALVRSLHQSGAQLYAWSTGGAAYAERMARELELEACFLGFLPKPLVLIDDRSWEELEPKKWIHPSRSAELSADDVLDLAKP